MFCEGSSTSLSGSDKLWVYIPVYVTIITETATKIIVENYKFVAFLLVRFRPVC